jgi:TorA maturation chaperone TorD
METAPGDPPPAAPAHAPAEAPRANAQRLRVLALLLAMPEADSLAALREAAAAEPWLHEAVTELAPLPLARWQAEHTRLFIAGFPRTPCPPFESAYRHGNMGGTAPGELRGLYRRAGLEIAEAPADYLGTLLDCAAYLTDLHTGAGAPAAGCRAGQLLHELWDEHLDRWLPRFAADLGAAAQLLLYQRLAEALAQLARDRDDAA